MPNINEIRRAKRARQFCACFTGVQNVQTEFGARSAPESPLCVSLETKRVHKRNAAREARRDSWGIDIGNTNGVQLIEFIRGVLQITFGKHGKEIGRAKRAGGFFRDISLLETLRKFGARSAPGHFSGYFVEHIKGSLRKSGARSAPGIS